MIWAIAAGVLLLSLANGSNDNFKGVATLWGSRVTSYRAALAWATVFTFLGSLAAMWLGRGLAAKFSGSGLVSHAVSSQSSFLAAVVLGAAATVLLASRLGLPISTTHALAGALVGAGTTAAGLHQVHLGALGGQVLLPLLFSPFAALGLTLALYPLARRLQPARDCVCVEAAPAAAPQPADGTAVFSGSVVPAVRWDSTAECRADGAAARLSASEGLHWFSGAAISFARGLNDTPKIVATLLVVPAFRATAAYGLVAGAIAVGAIAGARRVARTLSQQITPMEPAEAVTANLVAAGLVGLASFWALPVSTTHVTSGGLFGIGWTRREAANWKKVREIAWSWVGTLPLGAAIAAALYLGMAR